LLSSAVLLVEWIQAVKQGFNREIVVSMTGIVALAERCRHIVVPAPVTCTAARRRRLRVEHVPAAQLNGRKSDA
jgi:hypothetical protein